MVAEESEYLWEMDTDETEKEDATMAVAEIEIEKSEDAGSKTVTTEAKDDEPEKAAVRRNKRGYRILE